MIIKLTDIYKTNPQLLPKRTNGYWDSDRQAFCQCNSKEKEAIKKHFISEAFNRLPSYGMSKDDFLMVPCTFENNFSKTLCEAVNICLKKTRNYRKANIETHRQDKTWEIDYYRLLDDSVFDELDDAVIEEE